MAAPDEPLHEDAVEASALADDGSTVRNLSPAEYEASYADGDPHPVAPPEVLAELGIDTGKDD